MLCNPPILCYSSVSLWYGVLKRISIGKAIQGDKLIEMTLSPVRSYGNGLLFLLDGVVSKTTILSFFHICLNYFRIHFFLRTNFAVIESSRGGRNIRGCERSCNSIHCKKRLSHFDLKN